MSFMVQKNEMDQEQKLDMQNSQNLMLQNNDSNKYSANNNNHNKNGSSWRKTSKRRQAQQEKAVILELFKDLIKVVNQKFENAYLSPPKPKMPKPPKIVKQPSVRPQKKEQAATKKKEENIAATIAITTSHMRLDDKSQSRQLSQPSFPTVNHLPAPHTTNPPPLLILTPPTQTLPIPFQTFNSSSHVSVNQRKASQSHAAHASHREKSLNEKHNVLKEALKKEIFENYSLEMKYIIHEDVEEEAEEVKHSADNSHKMVDESSEQQHNHHQQNSQNNQNLTHKNNKNLISSEHFDDFELLSHEEEMQENFIKSIKNITNPRDIDEKLIEEELEKCEKEQRLHDGQGVSEDSSSSSSQSLANQTYPPHAHIPEVHASTTQQFLQQHHPIITSLPHSSEVLLTSLQHLQHMEHQQLHKQPMHQQSKIQEEKGEGQNNDGEEKQQ